MFNPCFLSIPMFSGVFLPAGQWAGHGAVYYWSCQCAGWAVWQSHLSEQLRPAGCLQHGRFSSTARGKNTHRIILLNVCFLTSLISFFWNILVTACLHRSSFLLWISGCPTMMCSSFWLLLNPSLLALQVLLTLPLPPRQSSPLQAQRLPPNQKTVSGIGQKPYWVWYSEGCVVVIFRSDWEFEIWIY